MPLTKEQIKELKFQLQEQVKNLPESQKKAAQQQIEEMSDEAIESMLNQQKSQTSKQIYRSIISEEIPSKKIDENKYAIAVLEIKPISKGHIIIIQKKQAKKTDELTIQSFNLAKKLSKKIISKLKAKITEIQTQFQFEEMIINIIPIYDKPLSINSPRYDASDEELQEIYNKLKTKQKPKVIKLTKKRDSKTIILKRRIP